MFNLFGPAEVWSDGLLRRSMEEDRAALIIQSTHRGRSDRRQVANLQSEASSPSVSPTPELIRTFATDLKLTADGRKYAHTRLHATGERLGGSLTGVFVGVPHLITVDLSNNRLSTLDGLEALPGLASLTCRHNRLLGILDYPAPKGGSRLRFADLSDNIIAGAVSLPKDRSGRTLGVDAHSSLEELIVDNNRLRSLRGISAVEHLTAFSASGNQLYDTAGLRLPRLRKLDLHGSGLAGCKEIAALSSLYTLQLQSNKLSKLPDLTALASLTSLDLRHNNLSSLRDLGDALGRAEPHRWRSIRLEGNPLLEGLDDMRMRVLYELPSVQELECGSARPLPHITASAHTGWPAWVHRAAG